MKVQSLYGSAATDVGTVTFKDGRIFERHSSATMKGSAVTGRVWSFSDITERSLAEKTLRASESKFRSLVENIADVVIRYDLDLRSTYVSPVISSWLDMRPADLLGKTHLEAGFPEALAALFDDALQRALLTKLPVEVEFAVPGLSGELFAQTRVFPELDAAGRVTSIVSVSRDMTARRQAEAALRESEIKFRTVADNTYDWEWWVAPDGRYIYVSPSCERITGYRAQAFLDDPDLLVAIAHPDDAALLREHVSSGAGVEPSEGCRLEFRIITAAGEVRMLEHLCQEVLGEDGERLGRRGSNRDITEQVTVQNELLERKRVLDTLMGNLPGMAYRCIDDGQWTMEFVSAGCEALTGYPPEALIGNAQLSYADIMHPDDLAAERRETEAAIARDEPWTTTYRITTAAGDLIWVWERGSALTDENGDLVALEGFVHEITSEHEAEVRLEAAAAEWRRTFDAMRDSVAVFDGSGRVVRCNRATATMSGRPLDDLAGRPCYEVFHGSQDFHEACPQRRAFASGQPETSLIEQDGMWLRVTFEPQTDDAGVVCGGVHMVTDVTDLKLGERQLQESIAKQERITEGVIAALAQSLEVRRSLHGWSSAPRR